MSDATRIRTWTVEYLLPYAANSSAVPDSKAKGQFRHREVMTGSTQVAVIREIRQLSGVPVDVREQAQPHPLFNRVTVEYRQQFLMSLMFSVDGGVSAGRALEQLIVQETGPMRARLNLSLDLLRRGRSFVEAFQALDLYDETTLAIIEAGEEIGKLPQALHTASKHLEKNTGSQKLLYSALSITAIDLVFSVMSIIGTRYGLIPELEKQGAGNDATPEAVETFKTAMAIAKYGNDFMIWGTMVLIIALGLSVYAYFGRNQSFRSRVDNVLIRIWVVRDLMLHTAVSATSGVMASLLNGGVPFLQACTITSRGSRMPTVVGYWLKASANVESGEQVSKSLSMAPLQRNEQMLLASHRDVQQLATSFELIAKDREEKAKKASTRFTRMAIAATLIYSGISVLLTLYVVYIQNQGALHGVSG